jgi:hypothetical protein
MHVQLFTDGPVDIFMVLFICPIVLGINRIHIFIPKLDRCLILFRI